MARHHDDCALRNSPLKRTEAAFQGCQIEADERLVEKGTTADALYTLVEGTVELRRTPDEDPVLLSEGDVVGISSLLGQADYGADVTARGKVREKFDRVDEMLAVAQRT